MFVVGCWLLFVAAHRWASVSLRLSFFCLLLFVMFMFVCCLCLLMCVVICLLFFVCCSSVVDCLFFVCCVLCVVCYLSCVVVRCVLFVVCCVLFLVCGFLNRSYQLLFVICCMLFFCFHLFFFLLSAIRSLLCLLYPSCFAICDPLFTFGQSFLFFSISSLPFVVRCVLFGVC